MHKNLLKGKLALVLHAHLPYVRSASAGSLEEDWFFQALTECYLPLVKTISNSLKDKNQNPKITISLSPTLLSLLEDDDLKERFPIWLNSRIEILKDIPKSYEKASFYLSEFFAEQLETWSKIDYDLINKFAELQSTGAVDLLTCAATHGYLPLLRENIEAIRGQIKTAIREHQRLIGERPLGIWLPECAYFENLDKILINSGIRYTILDGHGILNASPRPRYGLYSPICSRNGVAFFGRDSNSTLPVWSSTDGYPGNPKYREFHNDVGWELSKEKLNNLGYEEPRPIGIKLHKITNKKIDLNKKSIYEPNEIKSQVRKHANSYMIDRKKQLEYLNRNMTVEPILVAPFDAELFGHWWFEGPLFLEEIFVQAKKFDIKFTNLRDYLKESQTLQLCNPSPSSWGQGGFHTYWINEKNSWIIPEWNKASKAMINICSSGVSKTSDIRYLRQAARELLLSQSSDWSFILRAGTTTELAKNRIDRHLKRFWDLIGVIRGDSSMTNRQLIDIEEEDSIFPLIQVSDWMKI